MHDFLDSKEKIGLNFFCNADSSLKKILDLSINFQFSVAKTAI